MANNYTLASECYGKFTKTERRWLKQQIKKLELYREDSKRPKGCVFRQNDLDSGDFTAKFDGDALHVYSEENFSIDAFVTLFTAFLHVHPKSKHKRFELTWAATCSAPRAGEFGGGYVIVTRDSVKFGNTWDMVAEASK